LIRIAFDLQIDITGQLFVPVGLWTKLTARG
jgi:hypothetical protein